MLGFGKLRSSFIDALGQQLRGEDARKLKQYVDHILAQESQQYKPEPYPIKPTPAPFHHVHGTTTTTATTTASAPTDFSKSMSKNSHDISLLHPVLGEQLIDLGYKKVYATNVRRLLHSPIWEKQRILRPERSARIVKEKMKNKSTTMLPGVITMFEDKKSGRIGIVDGQHRVGALVMMAQQGLWNDLNRNVLVDVFPTDSEEEVVSLFKEINAAEPVRLIDLDITADSAPINDIVINDNNNNVISKPAQESTVTTTSKPQQEEKVETIVAATTTATTVTTTTTPTPTKATKKTTKATTVAATVVAPVVVDVRRVITEAVEVLLNRYPAMFKPTSRCRPPHLNSDVLRDELYQADFLQRPVVVKGSVKGSGKGVIETSEALVQRLEEINARLAAKYNATTTTTVTRTKQIEGALEKARQYNFFLGMEKAWIHDDDVVVV